MDPTRISNQVSVKHCSLCQGDTAYYCYSCQKDLCIQCKKLHVVDLSTKHHTVSSYTEKMKYPPKKARYQNYKPIIRWRSVDHTQAISAYFHDTDVHEPCDMLFAGHRPKKFQPPVWLSPEERTEIQRRQYSDSICYLRRETIYYKSVLSEGLKHDRKTGYKAVTIRG